MKRQDLRNEFPWVKVNKQNYQIIKSGTFQEINQCAIEGHVMTETLYHQLIQECYDTKTFQ